jgi:tetratricopeptide (TPR) repeat protein
LREQGRLEEAEQYFREALEIRLKLLGSSHADTVVTQIIFAESLRRQRKFDEAEALAEQARATAERQYEPRHARAVSPLYVLGRIRHDQGRLAEAEVYLRDALAIAEKSFPDDWSTHSSRFALGGVLVARERYAEAEPLLLSSFENVRHRSGGIPVWGKIPLKEAAQALVQLYQATGQTEKLAQWQMELRELERLTGTPTTRRADGVTTPSSGETTRVVTP